MLTLTKRLHQDYIKSKDPKKANGAADAAAKPDAKDASDNNVENSKGRKPNFFERKRFLNHGDNEDSGADDNKAEN
mgnify:CR=1 FL=1